MRVALHPKFVQLPELQKGNREEATAIRKAIALLRQAIGSSPRENTETTKLESIIVDLNCIQEEDELHLHGVRVVQHMHEDDQGW
ncbi:hypothetical protein Tco_0283033 [Tanacetum coccineum]